MSRRREKEVVTPSNTDLFGWLDACWAKTRPEGTPPVFMMHRFLASDRDLAQVARYLQVEIRDSSLIFGTWQAMLPEGRGAPKGLRYVAPRKAPAEETLVTKMKDVLSESRRSVEAMLEVVRAGGRLPALYAEFGVEMPKAKE